jgi:hypothetical protein
MSMWHLLLSPYGDARALSQPCKKEHHILDLEYLFYYNPPICLSGNGCWT